MEKWRRYLLFPGEYLFLEKPRGLDFPMQDTGCTQRVPENTTAIAKRMKGICGRSSEALLFPGAEGRRTWAAAKAWS